MIEKREELLREKKEFEAVANDSTRLLSKKRDPGRLLREEKFRKMLAKYERDFCSFVSSLSGSWCAARCHSLSRSCAVGIFLSWSSVCVRSCLAGSL